MKALLFHRYGSPRDVLRLEDVDTPVPGEGQVLVRIHAASANPVEWHLVRGEPSLVRLIAGLRAPKDPFVGGDGAGVVEALGPGVTDFAVGDAVFGTTLGSFAEAACAKVERIAHKPERLTFEQAATLPVAGCTALQAVRDHGRVEPGQRALVVGAAGGVGSFAVQIAKALGAHVTGVCSTANVEFVREVGADEVIDYRRDEPSGAYDVVLQVAGNASLGALRKLAPHGTVILVGSGVGRDATGGVLRRMARARLTPRVATFIAKINRADLETVAELVTPVISKTYALGDAASALEAIEAGHVRGKLVISLR